MFKVNTADLVMLERCCLYFFIVSIVVGRDVLLKPSLVTQLAVLKLV